jgi:Family of unknown function (DUF5947)
VSTTRDSLASSRLRRLAQSASQEREAALERCELCGEVIPANHRHLLDLQSRELMCACQACKILFDRKEAGVGHYRLVPDRRLRIEGFRLEDEDWAALEIPVDMAFFFHSTRDERVSAFYPSPAGPTESLLRLDAWQDIERANPVLLSLEPDVEALLVNRARGVRQHFIVPIEDPYRLVALIRSRWRGLTGGQEVWEGIESFFADLAEGSRTVANDRQEDAA